MILLKTRPHSTVGTGPLHLTANVKGCVYDPRSYPPHRSFLFIRVIHVPSLRQSRWLTQKIHSDSPAKA